VSDPRPPLAIPLPTRLRRALRLSGLARRMRQGGLGGPRRDQVELRAMDAFEAAEHFNPRFARHRDTLVDAVAAAGIARLPVFSRPRSMVR